MASFHHALGFNIFETQYSHHMDWLICHLIREVVTHYWYDVQCKVHGNKCKHSQGVCYPNMSKLKPLRQASNSHLYYFSSG